MKSFNKIISSWSKKKAIFIWVVMNFIVIAMMDLALFGQTTGKLKDASWHKKLLHAEIPAIGQWLFIVPSERIGNHFMTAPQLGLSSFLFDFIGQIITNVFWLKIPIPIDDWAAMGIILGAMYVSVYKVFG